MKEEDRVRAAMFNGSRLNVNAPKDIMRDDNVTEYLHRIKELSKGAEDFN